MKSIPTFCNKDYKSVFYELKNTFNKKINLLSKRHQMSGHQKLTVQLEVLSKNIKKKDAQIIFKASLYGRVNM